MFKQNIGRVVAIATAVMMAFPTTVLAAPKQMSDGTYFDAEYYASTNPDVFAAFGNDESLLWQHYLMFGKNEGRLPTNPNVEKQILGTDVASRILALQGIFPEGTSWTNTNRIYSNPVWPFYGTGCVAFSMNISDAVYGTSAKVTRYYNLTANDLQPGDMVKTRNNTHSVIVISVTDTAVMVCEGNYNGTVHWGRVISKASLDVNYVIRRG